MAIKKIKGKLHIYDGSLDCEEVMQDLLSAEVMRRLSLSFGSTTVEDHEGDYDAKYEIEIVAHDDDVVVDAVIMPLVLPTLEFEDGRRYEGIGQIKRFLESPYSRKGGQK